MNKYVIIRSMLSYIMASLILRHQRVLTPCLASYKQTVVNAIALIWDLRGPAQHKKKITDPKKIYCINSYFTAGGVQQ